MTAQPAPRHAAGHSTVTQAARLVVAWQHPITRQISPVGFLEATGSAFRFRYIAAALHVDGFRPLIGFPNFFESYESSQLFPLFAQRVMSARRPEFKSFLAELDLSGDDGLTPMEILARSGGRRAGDTLQLIPVPQIDHDGLTSCKFLIHGIRHRLEQDPAVESALAALKPGDRLILRDEPTNPHNERAIIALGENRVAIGWVPDLLLDYVHEVRTGQEPLVRVLHVNDPTSPPYLRLLAELIGHVSSAYRPFSGPQWAMPNAARDDLVAI